MPENAAESHPSSARFVGQPADLPERWQKTKTTAITPEFYNELNFWQLPKPTKTLATKSGLDRIKTQTNQNTDFGKPDFAKTEQSQRNRQNFTNSTYLKLCYKKTRRF